MAFVNARVTPEEAADFAAQAIPNPGNSFLIMRPYNWTIDRDANVYLIKALQERDDASVYHFLLGWKGAALAVKLRETWTQSSPRVWELLSIQIPQEQEEQRTSIMQSIKEALTVYGADGDPDEPFNTVNQSVQVAFKF